MEAYLLEWLNLLARWLHVIAGIAWIGASFYFVWLDDSLETPRDPTDQAAGVSGEVWSVHGGGFYHAQKYRVAPGELPPRLHWFKWEAYTTWISGFFLLCVMYFTHPGIYLIAPRVADLSPGGAIGAAIGFLIGGWLAYDLLCKSPLGRDDRALAVAVSALTVALAWGLTHVFSGRAAFLLFGATLGTIMAANVLFSIIPGQRELVRAKEQGREPDPRPGLLGKQRSVHNTYFTLPVVFAMLSNHYAFTFDHPYNWVILLAMSAAGALIRLFFVLRHKPGRRGSLAVSGGLALALLAGVAVALVPPVAVPPPGAIHANFAQVRVIVHRRCVVCHSAHPKEPGFAGPPKGYAFDTGAEIRALAPLIYQQAVVTGNMPLGNVTRMTRAERAIIGAWYRKAHRH